jgi:hypothetical protein
MLQAFTESWGLLMSKDAHTQAAEFGRLKQSKVMLFMSSGKSISACMSTKSAMVPITGSSFHNGAQKKISMEATAINLGRRTCSRKVCSWTNAVHSPDFIDPFTTSW